MKAPTHFQPPKLNFCSLPKVVESRWTFPAWSCGCVSKLGSSSKFQSGDYSQVALNPNFVNQEKLERSRWKTWTNHLRQKSRFPPRFARAPSNFSTFRAAPQKWHRVSSEETAMAILSAILCRFPGRRRLLTRPPLLENCPPNLGDSGREREERDRTPCNFFYAPLITSLGVSSVSPAPGLR